MGPILGLDWGVFAAIIVALAAVVGLILQFMRRERPWKKAQENHNLRLTAVEIKIENVSDAIDDLKQAIDDHEVRDQKDFERIEGKIEKLTDLMIDMIGQKSAPTKARKK